MENMNKKVKRMARGNARRKLWHRAVAIPAAIVVFVTTYALILPAIAMERDTYCGLEAHQHTAECYTAELACGYEDGATVQDVQLVTELACGASAHQHTADCYDETGAVICGYADYLVHEHTADCYAADGTLVCPLPQVEAHTHDENCYIDETVNVCGMAESEGHIHTADCYSLVSHPELVCGMAESAGHIHTADCYTTRENTYLACGMAESAGHIHGEGCYVTTVAEDGTETTELVCTEPESMGHTHTEACWATETVTELTCGQAESAGHTHTDACWANVETLELTCGQAESAGHTHTDACYATQKRLVCPKPEVILHTHNDDCYTVTVLEDGTENRELTCTQTVIEEHVHTADCFHTYEQTIERPHEHTDLCYIQTLTCTLPEHEHTEECYAAPEVPEAPEAPEYICGLQGHTHTELCYDEAGELICGLEEHVHDETCLPVEIADGEPVEMGGEPDGNVQIVEDDTPAFQMPVLACGLAEHEHSTSCMDENMNYVCGLTAHAHTGDCYEIPGLAGVTPELVCDKHEHFHTEACYNENGEIACGLDEHTHGVGCFALPEGVADPDAAQAPGIDENTYWCGFEAHEHTEACLDANGVAVCGLPEHQHTDQCLVEPAWYCGYEAHTHGEGCFDETGALTCVLPEHTHSDACKTAPEVFCGLDAHVHGASCYGEDGALICGLEEHVHTADCKVQHFTQMAYADGVMVTASYTSEAGFPLDAVLQVTRFTEGEHYEDRVNEASEVFYAANPDQLFQPQALLNIGFYLPDGTEVEPLVPVEVTVQLLGADGLAEGEQYTVIHYGEAGTELLDADHAETAVNFSAESFSDFLINYDMDPSDGGSTVADSDESEDEGESSSNTEAVPPINWGNFLVGSFGSSVNNGDDDGMMMISNSVLPTEFEHNKTIDYLGDGGSNPDTSVDGSTSFDKEAVTDDLYRIYLDMTGDREPVDLLIILDRSGSMHNTDNPIVLNGKTTTRDKVVADILFGSAGTNITENSLIGQFLAPNEGKADSEKNYVAMVWYGGKPAINYDPYERTTKPGPTDTDSQHFRYTGVKISPADSSEGGVSFYWANSTKKINYNYTSDVEGAAYNGNLSTATNYVAGFVQADQMLKDKTHETERTGHKQVVIFISDGVPTLYYKSSDFKEAFRDNSYGTLAREGFGSDIMSISDLSSSGDKQYHALPLIYEYNKNKAEYQGIYTLSKDGADQKCPYKEDGKYCLVGTQLKNVYDSPYYNETAECFKFFAERYPNINFFTLGIDMNTAIDKNIETQFVQKEAKYWVLDEMAECYGGRKALRTVGSEQLAAALRQIMFPSGVSITDELSAYVDLYTDQPDVKVTATEKANPKNIITLWEGYGPGKAVNNQVGSEKSVVAGVTYDSGSKKITVNFRDDYCLDKNYTFTLSFNVRLTEKAYNDYAAMKNKTGDFASGQYPNVGDKDGSGPGKTATTDYGGNQTSSGKPGFYSNNTARVDYTIDNNTYHQFYDRPVVQAWGTRFMFEKTADDKTGGVAGMPFQLRLKRTGESVFKVYEFPGCERYKSKDEASNGWFLTDTTGFIDFGFLPCGEYELWEMVPAEYSSNVGLDHDGQQVKWMTFTVEKGRIINVETNGNVTWSGDDVSNRDKYDFNSEPNTNYEAGKAVLTVENQSYKKPLEIYKADKDGTNMLAGAKFLLSVPTNEEDAEGKPIWDALNAEQLREYFEGEPVGFTIEEVDEDKAYLVSGESGLAFKGELPYGTYYLTEQFAPLNYDVDLGALTFTVDESGIHTDSGNGPFDFELAEDGLTMVLTINDKPIEVNWQLRKVDASNTEVPLSGAEFKLYGPYDEKAAGSFNADTAADGDLRYYGRTDSEGKLVGIEGYVTQPLPQLQAGMFYFLVETKAPDGFNRLEKPIKLHANQKTAGGPVTLTVTPGDGKPETIEPDAGSDPAMYTVTVKNTTGYELPESGGVGTTVYTLSGLAMLALAGAMFCANRRKSRT